MKKSPKKVSIITLLFVILSVLSLYANDSYWSHFYTKKKERTTVRSFLSVSPLFAKTFGQLEDYSDMGAGIALEWKQTRGLLMYGFGISSIYFWGKSINKDKDNSNESENSDVVNMYLMIPIYFKLGMNFQVTNEFGIMPYVKFGGCNNLLKYAEEGVSALGASEYTMRYGMTLLTSAGVDFQYWINSIVSVHLEMAFNNNIDIVSGFKMGMFSSAKAGVLYNF